MAGKADNAVEGKIKTNSNAKTYFCRMSELTYIDIIGWVATAFTLLSFMCTKMSTLRLINFIGCIFWIAYGVLDSKNPIIVTNLVIATIHLVWYIKLKIKNKATASV